MGLHLNWELRLPASTSDAAVCASLRRLRDSALEQGFEEVSPLVQAFGPQKGTAVSWTKTLEFWASLVAKPYEDESPPMRGDPATAQGFFVQPGEGCETASFGLLRRADDARKHTDWFWHCSCKTQYASIVSDEHLIRCHTSLVRVLERAVDIGLDVIVRDETHYWETRDESRLLSEVHKMNSIVARIAGKLSDASASADIRAPIFAHRRFERLEMGDE